jgi:hypothetical protein
MSNINVLLNSASVQVLDQATLTYRVNTPVGTITLSATGSNHEVIPIQGGGGNVLVFPVAVLWAVYVKNLDSVANITVQVQAVGGALTSAANSPILTPGGVWMYFNPAETAGGISAITLVSSAGPSPVELLLAG